MELIERLCPICHVDHGSKVISEAHYDEEALDGFAFASRKVPEYMHFRLMHCPHCDVIYANPIPSLETIQQEYEKAEFDSSLEAAYAARSYINHLKTELKTPVNGGRALDIGTGSGDFLEELQSIGFAQVEGIEPSLAPIQAAKGSIRPFIRHGVFEGQNYPSNHFDLISCFQTLEHLRTPKELADRAYQLLKPGGMIFLVDHNYRAFLNRLLKEKSPIYDIEHLQLYSPKSLRCLLESAGFEKISIQPLINTYPFQYWFKLFPFPTSLKQKFCIG